MTHFLRVSLAAAVLLAVVAGSAPAQLVLDFTDVTQNAFQAEATFGWSFSTSQPLRVDGMGFFDDFLIDGQGLRQDHRVRIWTDEAMPTLMADTTITNASTAVVSTAADGQWMFNDVPPVVLAPGDYVIGADDPACDAMTCDWIRFLDTATTIPELTFIEARDISPPGFPTSTLPERNAGYFGPTFSATVVPEPSALALVALALAAMLAFRRD